MVPFQQYEVKKLSSNDYSCNKCCNIIKVVWKEERRKYSKIQVFIFFSFLTLFNTQFYKSWLKFWSRLYIVVVFYLLHLSTNIQCWSMMNCFNKNNTFLDFYFCCSSKLRLSFSVWQLMKLAMVCNYLINFCFVQHFVMRMLSFKSKRNTSMNQLQDMKCTQNKEKRWWTSKWQAFIRANKSKQLVWPRQKHKNGRLLQRKKNLMLSMPRTVTLAW